MFLPSNCRRGQVWSSDVTSRGCEVACVFGHKVTGCIVSVVEDRMCQTAPGKLPCSGLRNSAKKAGNGWRSRVIGGGSDAGVRHFRLAELTPNDRCRPEIETRRVSSDATNSSAGPKGASQQTSLLILQRNQSHWTVCQCKTAAATKQARAQCLEAHGGGILRVGSRIAA